MFLLHVYYNSASADFEFGRLQARDMLQHLWTGPISNASVEVVQGSRSVEVRPVGVTKVTRSLMMDLYSFSILAGYSTKFCLFFPLYFWMQGSAIDRILGEIVHSKPLKSPIDYVLCIGHFLEKVNFKFLIQAFCIVAVAKVKKYGSGRLFSLYSNKANIFLHQTLAVVFQENLPSAD